jgi:hypothetical protein
MDDLRTPIVPIGNGNTIAVIDPSVVSPSISWGSVLAGAAAAIAVQIGLFQLCTSFGLSLYEQADPGSSISVVMISGAIALVISAIASLFVGGWVAGRLAGHSSSVDAAIHGGLVWAFCGIVGLVVVGTAAGAIAGGTVYLAGQSVTAIGTGAVAAGSVAKELVAPTWDLVKEQIEGETSKLDEAEPSDDRLSERSRLMELLASSFSPDSTPEKKEKEKAELITLIASQTGVSPAAAGRAYEQWQRMWQEATARYENAKLAAETNAKEAAAVVAAGTSQAALYAFLATLMGLAAAGGGAVFGRTCVCRRNKVDYFAQPLGTSRPDRVADNARDSAGLTRSLR